LSPMVREAVRRGELRILMPGWRSEPLPTHVLYPPTRVLPARIRVWVDWLVALYAEEVEAAQRFLAEAERTAARRRATEEMTAVPSGPLSVRWASFPGRGLQMVAVWVNHCVHRQRRWRAP